MSALGLSAWTTSTDYSARRAERVPFERREFRDCSEGAFEPNVDRGHGRIRGQPLRERVDPFGRMGP